MAAWQPILVRGAMPNHQYSLSLIAHQVQNSVVEQRAADGYINATAMCKATGKLMADYTRLKSTKEFLDALAVDMGIPISQLIQTLRDGVQNSAAGAV